MARYVGYKRPKNTKKTLKALMKYMGNHKWMLALVALLCLSAPEPILWEPIC